MTGMLSPLWICSLTYNAVLAFARWLRQGWIVYGINTYTLYLLLNLLILSLNSLHETQVVIVVCYVRLNVINIFTFPLI